jgi:hypothetical protein
MEMYRNPVDNTISRIVLPISTVVFDMELRGFITVVEGWSGTGKTFFLNSLKSFYMNNKNMIRQKFGLQGILFYDFNDIDKDILFAVKRVKGYLILIDNADMLLAADPKLLKYISHDTNNQYFIMSRGGVALAVTPNHYCELVREDKKITTRYNCSVEGWM